MPNTDNNTVITAATEIGNGFELLERSPAMPEGADFCITVHGDFMEPYIGDGELVFVRRDAPLEEFDVGLFYMDGRVYCRQWCVDYTGALILLCANPKRQDANSIIPAAERKGCVCLGKVLLPRKLPRPCYY